MSIKKSNRTMQPSNAATAEPQNSAVLECRFCGCGLAELQELPCQNCGTEEIYRFVPVGTPKNYSEIQKQFGFKDYQIAAIFGLAAHDFKTSTAKERYKKAVERLYYLFFFHD